MTETVGIIIKSDIDLEKEKLDFQSTLDVLERGGLIGRTPDGKIYLTKRGKTQESLGFSIKNTAYK